MRREQKQLHDPRVHACEYTRAGGKGERRDLAAGAEITIPAVLVYQSGHPAFARARARARADSEISSCPAAVRALSRCSH